VLLVEFSGEREKEELTSSAKKAWREITGEAREKKSVKILVLSSATVKYSVLDPFLINSNLDESGVHRGWQIAFVNLDQASFQDVKFAETVAVNRGFDIGVFNNEDNARK
jgi:hypothetical protein